MSKRPNPPNQSAEAFKLADILPAISKELRLDEKAKEFSLLSVFDELLGQQFDGQFCGKARALRIQTKAGKRQLVVLTENGTVANELSFYTAQLLEQLNAFAAQTGIRLDAVQCRIGKR